jgi:hypothetical protein
LSQIIPATVVFADADCRAMPSALVDLTLVREDRGKDRFS